MARKKYKRLSDKEVVRLRKAVKVLDNEEIERGNKKFIVRDIARKFGLSGGTVEAYATALRHGYDSPTKYQRSLLTKRNINSRRDYLQHLAETRGTREKVIERARLAFSEYLTLRLGKLGKTQGWLAKEVGISRNAVNLYVHAEMTPRSNTLVKILYALGAEQSRLPGDFKHYLERTARVG